MISNSFAKRAASVEPCDRSPRLSKLGSLMRHTCLVQRYACVLVFLFLGNGFAPAQQQRQEPQSVSKFPFPEKLSYRVEWRLIAAGTATVQLSHGTPTDWETKMDLQSAGLVTRLYRVLDTYTVISDDDFCASRSVLDAQEGKRHKLTQLTFENSQHKVDYNERDLLRNTTVRKEIRIAPCTREIVGALTTLRATDLQPGKSITLPVTDGKKLVNVRVEAQSKEKVSVAGKNYQTVRYEAFLFDNVLYQRKGRVLLWITDDTERLPVQIRFQLGFPIGTISLELDKQQKL